MKRLVLLGASGSIGTQTLDVIRQHPDLFELAAFGVGQNIDRCEEILHEFPVRAVSVSRKEDAAMLRVKYPDVDIYDGDAGLEALARFSCYDVLVNALVGFAGFLPTLRAIESGHDVALANKETLVAGGELIDRALKQYGRKLLPIDSEHSAIFQCLQGNRPEDVARLIITASGGAFRNLSREQLKDVTVDQALAHPNWAMGAKITVDSATMMNKGFEVMEAHWLFGIPYERISVLMHDESMIHSMVEYVDHSFIAQMGLPDMRLPIQYALSWPIRLPLQQESRFDLAEIGSLHFHAPDPERYPALVLAIEAGQRGGNHPAVLNAANEVANAAFRSRKISFPAIDELLKKTMDSVPWCPVDCVEDLLKADEAGRHFALQWIEETMK